VLLARRTGMRLRIAAVEVSIVDLAWVATTAVVIAAADMSGVGVAVAVAMGFGVLAFAVLQIFFARRITD